MSERAQEELKAREHESETPVQDEPVAREASQRDRLDGGGAQVTALFAPEEVDRFRTRWTEIQSDFVDDPRHVVEQADGLVAEVMKRLTDQFTETRESLESQWGRSEDVSTEDLRVALQRYRSFFERLLAA